MCLAMPMEIVKIIDDNTALVKAGENNIKINITLIEDPKIGEFAIIHAGFAIQVIDFEEANERLKLFKELEQISYE